MLSMIAFIVLTLLSLSSHATHYSITRIGWLYPSTDGYSQGFDLNDYGVVAGYSYSYGDNHFGRTFIWDDIKGHINLGTFNGGSTYPNGINNDNTVLGYQSSPTVSFVWDEINGMVNAADHLGFDLSSVEKINNSGQIVGVTPGDRAFRWDPSTGYLEIEPLAGNYTFVKSLNQTGQAAGGYTTGDYGSPQHAYHWDETVGMTDLGTLDGRRASAANDLNDNNQVVGHSWDRDSSSGWNRYNQQAFIWDEDNGMIPLGSFGAGLDSFALAINNQEKITGYGPKSPYRDDPYAFVWDESAGIQDLLSLVVEKSQWSRLAKAEDINEVGQIAGWGYTSDGRFGFLLTPVDETQPMDPLEKNVFLGDVLIFESWWHMAVEPDGSQEFIMDVMGYIESSGWTLIGQISTTSSSDLWQYNELDVPPSLQGETARIQFSLAEDYPENAPRVYLKQINDLPFVAIDADSDGDVDGLDLASIVLRFSAQADSADLTHDGSINASDIALFSHRFGWN